MRNRRMERKDKEKGRKEKPITVFSKNSPIPNPYPSRGTRGGPKLGRRGGSLRKCLIKNLLPQTLGEVKSF